MRARAVILVVLCCAVAVAGCGAAESGEPRRPEPPRAPASESGRGHHFDVERVASGLNRPTFVAAAPGDPGALWVLEQPGRVVRIGPRGGRRVALDIGERVRVGGEQGLLGIAFHPDFATDRRVYLHWSDPDGDTRVAELEVARDGTIDPEPRRVLLALDQPEENHNGGQLAFGPDGRLYLGLGDGGGAFDRDERAQDLDDLHGKIVSLDVDAGAAGDDASDADGPDDADADGPDDADADGPDNASSADGPGGADDAGDADDAGGRDPGAAAWRVELYGLRNPWRFSFDPALAELWVADVGQDEIEEVDRVRLEPDEPPKNLGWSIYEGVDEIDPDETLDRTGALVWPVATYTHDDGCSVTGGFVYRGAAIPTLSGRYLYGDFCSGAIWTLEPAAGRHATDVRRERATVPQLTHIGADSAGEPVFASATGALYRAVPTASRPK